MLAACGADVLRLLEGFCYGDFGEQMTAGHDRGVADIELFRNDGTHILLEFGELEELLGGKQGDSGWHGGDNSDSTSSASRSSRSGIGKSGSCLFLFR